MNRSEVLEKALAFGTPLVELTGGEPLLQPGTIPLLRELCDAGRTVLIETSGEADVSQVDARVHKIMDLKAPGSGERPSEPLGESRPHREYRRDQIRTQRSGRLRLDEGHDKLQKSAGSRLCSVGLPRLGARSTPRIW